MKFCSAGKHGTGLYHRRSLFQSSLAGGLLTLAYVLAMVGIATKLFIDVGERKQVQTTIKKELIDISKYPITFD